MPLLLLDTRSVSHLRGSHNFVIYYTFSLHFAAEESDINRSLANSQKTQTSVLSSIFYSLTISPVAITVPFQILFTSLMAFYFETTERSSSSSSFWKYKILSWFSHTLLQEIATLQNLLVLTDLRSL